MPVAHKHNSATGHLPLVMAATMVVMGSLAAGQHGLQLLRDSTFAGNLISQGLWSQLVTGLGGTIVPQGGHATARLDSAPLLSISLVAAVFSWFAGGWCIARHRGGSFREGLTLWGLWGWGWWLLPLAWEFLDLAISISGWSDGAALMLGTLPLWHGMQWAGWLTTGCLLGRKPGVPSLSTNEPVRVPRIVWGIMALYILAFSAMNIGLYESLLLPHGDSAMYEEHLWNLLHGKGFRSYLDQGRLFLGEHIQVIHLLLIPIYLCLPSQITLEVCQSVALALAAIPLYRIAHRHSESPRAAAAVAIAGLLYVPLQFLDIAVDLKTFRPNSFEIPLFLLAFDALEERRWRIFSGSLLLALLCQEDAATIIAPLGVWIFLRARSLARRGGAGNAECGMRSEISQATSPESGNSHSALHTPHSAFLYRCLGGGLAVFGTVYVVLVIKVVLPWFRGGGDVHFAKYFEELGASSDSIVTNVLLHPQLVLGRLIGAESIGFVLAILAPLGLLPLFSPGRLAVAVPLFCVLCLSDITNSAQHHFHAPLVPVLLWAAAAGVAGVPAAYLRVRRWWPFSRILPPAAERSQRIEARQIAPSGKSLPADAVAMSAARATTARSRPDAALVECAALWCVWSSLCTGLFLGLSPLSIGFWDPGSRAHWRALYVPGERARAFAGVLEQIPPDSRVASTDFVHPRFTHFDRSYDYSDYRPDVPDDADFIVIDTRHPYSQIHRPEEIKEYRDNPAQWELLPDRTGGYFIVLRRVGEDRG